MAYSPDDMLMLSGIQHFAFCRRQWSLIHVFRQWAENSLTVEGSFMHRNADEICRPRLRNGVYELRGVNVASSSLGLYGVCDVVELEPSHEKENSVCFDSEYWKIRPVEYKRGSVKINPCDCLQVCAQAVCLEEANNLSIDCAYIYYGKTRRRFVVNLDSSLRRETADMAKAMHESFDSGVSEPAEYSKKCVSCSMYEICSPKYESVRFSVRKYLKNLEET